MEGAKFDQQKEEFMNVDGEAEVDVDIMKELRSACFYTVAGQAHHSFVAVVHWAFVRFFVPSVVRVFVHSYHMWLGGIQPMSLACSIIPGCAGLRNVEY